MRRAVSICVFLIMVMSCMVGLGENLESLAQKCDTPRKLSNWLTRNIYQVSDEDKWGVRDYWQTPEDTLRSRSGDCEDIATLANRILRKLGYDSKIISVFPAFGPGHTICAFWDDGWWHLSSWGLWKTSASKLENLPRHIYSDWKIWKVNTESGRMTEMHTWKGKILKFKFGL